MKKKLCMLLLMVLVMPAAACGTKGGTNKDQTVTEESKDGSKADQAAYDIEKYVTLGDYNALDVSLDNTYEVTKAQVEETALRTAKGYAEPVYKDTNKTKVKQGDTVYIDYKGEKDGAEFKGGTAQGQYLTIGSHAFIEGFEDGLIGKKVGQTVKLDLTFPESYQNEELAGADVVFTVTIHKIVEEDTSVKFELTDAFAKEKLSCDSAKEYKKKIREYLEYQNNSNKQMQTQQAVILKLNEVCKVTVPDGLLEERVDDYIKQYEKFNCKDISLEEYLDKNMNGKTVEEFRSEATENIDNSLQTELILEAITKKEGMELDEDSFQDYVKQQMTALNMQTEEDLYSNYGVDPAAGEQYMRKIYLCNQALAQVVDNANITYGKK